MVRPNKTKSPQMPRFQVSHKVQSCFLIKHKYLQLQLAYPKLSNFFWIEINSGWHRSNHPPFHQKKKSQVKVQNSSDLRYQTPAAATWYPFGPVWASWIGKAKGRTNPSHQLPCTTGFPAFPPMWEIKRSSVVNDPPKGRHKKIPQFLPPNTCQLANLPEPQEVFSYPSSRSVSGQLKGETLIAFHLCIDHQGFPTTKTCIFSGRPCLGRFGWFVQFAAGRKVGSFFAKNLQKTWKFRKDAKKKKESPETKHHLTIPLNYICFFHWDAEWMPKRKGATFFSNPQNWWKTGWYCTSCYKKRVLFHHTADQIPHVLPPTLQC